MSKLRCSFVVFLVSLFSLSPASRAQQTLGSINGTVTDSSGGVVSKVLVRVRNVGTNLEQTTNTKDDGAFTLADLPIGTYEVTFSRDGFKTEVHSQILVQGNRTITVNTSLQPGAISSQVTVSATPLLNQTDTTNGYTLGSELIESAPLGTGSFTQLAILSPGVNADLLSGSGTNAGLGNQNIFANGQRDSSNSFNVNGVNTNNLFNGKSSSSVSANRFVLNTGESFTAGGEVQTSTSVYSAIGQALPSPPQETIEELHVNTSMYDASEGRLQRRTHFAADQEWHELVSRPGLRVSPDRRLECCAIFSEFRSDNSCRSKGACTKAQQLRCDRGRPYLER